MLTLVSLEQRFGYAIPFKIDRYHIYVTIKDQLASTRINQIFTNPNDFEVNGRYIFPVPDGAVVANMALSVDGEPVEGRLLSPERSHRIYRSSVRDSNNIGIIEHFGTQAFIADVRRIPANSERHIEFEYAQTIPVESDLVKYSHPLSLAKSANGPVADLAINMKIESQHELRTINSASHELKIDRKNDHHVHLSYEGTDIDPDDDFRCYYSISDDDLGMTLLTHRFDESEEGYFMLLVSPKYEVKKTDIIEKDFIFVLDHSGSMRTRGKIEQAKQALRYCVQNLNDRDRFNLILFNSDITSLADRLQKYEKSSGGERAPHSEALSHRLIDVEERREEALTFIDGIEARGGTNINDALLTALAEKPDPNRPRIIVFLTDGCPTVGVRNPVQILKNVAQANNNQSRIFVFGVGADLNMRLLDKLAADNGGSPNYVKPDEDIEEAVSSLFLKMNEPVLVNVELDFGQIITKELTPMNLPDLFREEQLMVLGRYERHGDKVIKLLGTIGSEQQEFTKKLHFAELEMENDHLPQLWAQRRIAELVDQAALGDDNDELHREIERLSQKYDVITPDTSFELVDDGSLRKQYRSNIGNAYHKNRPKDDAVRRSREIEERKRAQTKQQYKDIKSHGERSFHRYGKIWVDKQYDGNTETKKIEFGSDEYFNLASQSYELAKCLKLSRSMIICHNGVSYEIIDTRAPFHSEGS